MKNIILLLALLCAGTALRAQTTALDWTKDDCDGNTHSLYDELRNGHIVIMELVMMNCTPCVTAGNNLKNILQEYESTHPGRVKLYSISYNNSTTCTALKQWKQTNNFSWPVIAKGAEQTTYYGGMGMPTIVIAGGSSGNIYYKKLGFESSDLTAIRSALDAAMTSSSVRSTDDNSLIRVYPNPAADILSIESTDNINIRSYSIIDERGNTIVALPYSTRDIDVSSLAQGAYTLRIVFGDGEVSVTPIRITR